VGAHRTAWGENPQDAEKAGDLEGAARWYARAAEAGEAIAMTKLALLVYRRGDLDGAKHWYTKGAEAGNAGAMTELGALAIANGLEDEAVGWYLNAANLGHVPAMSELGRLFEGRGQLEQASDWHRKAANLRGGPDAAAALILLFLLDGQMKEALNVYRGGGTTVGSLLESAPRDRPDWLAKLIDFFRSLAQAGDVAAMATLGRLADEKGNQEEALAWFRKAATTGDSAAACNLIVLLMARDEEDEAVRWYEQACRRGMDTSVLGSQLALKEMRSEAVTLFQRGVRLGIPCAPRDLEWLKTERED
jgi:TPR repeat protein